MDKHPSTSVLQVEDNSINMQELSDSIEDIVSTPDIYLFFTPSTDHDENGGNIKHYATYNNIFNEIVNDNIEFLSKSSLPVINTLLNLDDDVNMTQDYLEKSKYQSVVPNSDSENNTYTYEMPNENIIQEEMQSINLSKTMFKKDNSGLIAGDLLKGQLIKRQHINFSNLIKVYCSICKKASTDYTDRKCQDCQTVLLFQCSNCTCVYKRLVSIQNHIKYDCYKESFFYCADCYYKTTRKMQLIKHIKNEHLALAPQNLYKCSICQRKFKIQQNMLAHEKICCMETTLQCKYCPYKTKFTSGLTMHIQRKHKEFNLQNYHKCPDCGKMYKNLKTLNSHIRALCGELRKFECNHCDYKINRKYSLEKHIQQNHPHLFLRNKFSSNFRNLKDTKSFP